MSTLTKPERLWLKKLEKVLLNPPSDRIGFYTIGDNSLQAYNQRIDGTVEANGGSDDFCGIVEAYGASLGIVRSACAIHSTAG